MKYQWISKNVAGHSPGDLCEALEVSRAGYHQWRKGRDSRRRGEDEVFKGAIEKIHAQVKGRYGHRPMHLHLRDEQVRCGRDRTLRLMKELGIQGKQKKRYKPVGTDSAHDFGYAPNWLKEIGKPERVDQVWVADTTYLYTRQGWKYLATVMDLYSRRILGWSVSETNDTALVLQALENAVDTRGELPEGVIHHSDRGSTYASQGYQKRLRKHGMKSSMSRKGNCYDNAEMESFYGRYKTSSVREHVFADERELRAHVFEYIELFYNRFRKHSSLGYRNPLQFEESISAPMGTEMDSTCPSGN